MLAFEVTVDVVLVVAAVVVDSHDDNVVVVVEVSFNVLHDNDGDNSSEGNKNFLVANVLVATAANVDVDDKNMMSVRFLSFVV